MQTTPAPRPGHVQRNSMCYLPWFTEWRGVSYCAAICDAMFHRAQEDLTYDGAERWLALVPSDVRKDVFYYTTEYGTAFLGRFPCLGGFRVCCGLGPRPPPVALTQLTTGVAR
jgi:hypothetical protein